MEDKIVKIINEMAEYLNVAQMKKLRKRCCCRRFLNPKRRKSRSPTRNI